MKFQAQEPPEWLSKSAVYQINPRTFSKEGTIQSIINELPSLRSLGFKIIYICPVFETDSSEDRTYWSLRQKASETDNPNNPYRMLDYFKIDSEYGTMEDLSRLIREAHLLGMRVLLDLVYLHIGPNAPITKSHPEFVQQNPDGTVLYNEYNFQLMDFDCPGLREYLWSNMIYYISALDVDGFRCDVGFKIPVDFWVEGRQRMRTIKPDAVLINEGENWDSLLRAFDCCYCFSWHENLYSAISGEMTASEIRKNEEERMKNVPKGGFLLRDIDNHDTVTDWPERTELRAGNDGMEMLEVLNYLMHGIPMVYCGNELADTAKLNMFANRFHMGKYEVTDRIAAAKTKSGIRRREIMKKLNKWRFESNALAKGEMTWIDNNSPQEVLSFKRSYGEETVIFIGNISKNDVEITLEEDVSSLNIVMSNNAEPAGGKIHLSPHGYVAMSTDCSL